MNQITIPRDRFNTIVRELREVREQLAEQSKKIAQSLGELSDYAKQDGGRTEPLNPGNNS